MRLAWFSPWPPDASGIASRSAELVPLLADRGHAIDVFVDERRTTTVSRASSSAPPPGAVRVQSAHEFLWRSMRGQYELVVYQVGNSQLHEYLWPYLWRVPGLAVLHDARLHHARGRALLSRRRADAYRNEFAWNEPAVSADAAELAVAGFSGAYYYQWPMIRAVVASARLTAAHSRGAVTEIATRWPDRPTAHIALGDGRASPMPDARRYDIRRRFGIASDALVFGVFGGLTPEKRLEPILDAFAALRVHVASAHLLLAGTPDPRLAIPSEIERLGLRGAVTLAPGLDDDDFDAAIAACDVSLNLRWPASLEMSGPWLRALAAGRPTVMTDLAHLSDIPTLDPRTWQLHPPAARGSSPGQAVAVALDILDEAHSLRVAMRRLSYDADLRTALGSAGRAYWEREHTVAKMADDYEAAFARAVSLPPPSGELPAHLRPDPFAHGRAVVIPFGVAGHLL